MGIAYKVVYCLGALDLWLYLVRYIHNTSGSFTVSSQVRKVDVIENEYRFNYNGYLTEIG